MRRCFAIVGSERVNHDIKEKEVRLIGKDGEQLGILSIKEALQIAEENRLDLVEVASNSKPVVCKILDYGKFRYEKGKKEKESKKKQKIQVLKEIKLKPRIDKHDLEVKTKRIEEFLEKDFKIKVTVTLFGRERAHGDLAVKILDDISNNFKDRAIIEKSYGSNESQKYIMISATK